MHKSQALQRPQWSFKLSSQKVLLIDFGASNLCELFVFELEEQNWSLFTEAVSLFFNHRQILVSS